MPKFDRLNNTVQESPNESLSEKDQLSIRGTVQDIIKDLARITNIGIPLPQMIGGGDAISVKYNQLMSDFLALDKKMETNDSSAYAEKSNAESAAYKAQFPDTVLDNPPLTVLDKYDIAKKEVLRLVDEFKRFIVSAKDSLEV